MPSTYAHYRFGQDVIKSLPVQFQDFIYQYKKYFDIGLHGPDILFYYKPLVSNKINQIGFGMHAKPAKEFFDPARSVLEVTVTNEREAALAYLYGFLCHFALDSSCHPYIEEAIQNYGITHTEIEVEFDRTLMVEDGYDPLTHPLTDHILPKERIARIIALFFPGLSPEHIMYSLESMKKYNALLIAPSHVKRCFIDTLLHVSGNYKEMHGLLVNYAPNPVCSKSNETLACLYQQALSLASTLIPNYQLMLQRKQPLSSQYNHTFGVE